LIQGGYATARAHTLERQAASLMQTVATECGVPIRRPFDSQCASTSLAQGGPDAA